MKSNRSARPYALAMKIGTALLPLGVVVIAAGCGGGSGTSKSSKPAAGAVVKTITIHEKEFALTPSSVTLSKTGTYVFKAVNDGTIGHAFELKGKGVEQKTSTISPGSSATITVKLSKSGSYDIYCPIDGHRQQGMHGTVKLGSGGGSSGGTTTGTTTGGYGGY
ncbi:MAG: cupredoxin domain-containing protein [Gaiellaceae bacterium]